MRETRLSFPELGLIGATRGLLGIGIGLLVAGRMSRGRQLTVGGVLAAIGALSTIPLVIRRYRAFERDKGMDAGAPVIESRPRSEPRSARDRERWEH